MEGQTDQEKLPGDYNPFRIKFSQKKCLQNTSGAEGREPVLQTMLRLSQASFVAGIIGTAPPMTSLFRTMLRLAESDEPILILGETGTGKELAARAIHQLGNLAKKPFLPIDCCALPSTLIETELFGYTRGAFTGAVETRKGLFEAAQGGAIFLDEIGDMPVEMQSKLLRAIQEHEIRPVGSANWTKFKGRIIVATNRNLELEVQKGSFRNDLYFRLNVLTLTMPPLRERKGDVAALANYFLAKYSAGKGTCPELSPEALSLMEAYDWPGNVRELENCIRRVIACNGPIVKEKELPENIRMGKRIVPISQSADEVRPLRDLERNAILHAIEHAYGDKVLAARMLGIGKTTLYRKLKAYIRSAQMAKKSESSPSTLRGNGQIASPIHHHTSLKPA